MSSFGQMVAGIAHEINNPVSFIYGNLHHAHQYTQDLLKLVQIYQQVCSNPPPEIQEQIKEVDLDFLIQDITKLFQSMKVGTERIQEIVKSLRNFSRPSRRRPMPGLSATFPLIYFYNSGVSEIFMAHPFQQSNYYHYTFQYPKIAIFIISLARDS
ncbi:histidine kinase dimerization/phospho-acceptor domain-containing protein [Nostoc sp.]|uniref:histidine kinase dimerization/phospho-acceptor domain-containing protein n=1 Tax=Nostoc sp. TaxID=1180 RepID=UPI002FFD15B4